MLAKSKLLKYRTIFLVNYVQNKILKVQLYCVKTIKINGRNVFYFLNVIIM